DRLHGDYAVRAAGRICAPLSDSTQRECASHVAIRSVDPGAHLRPADGARGLRLCADPGTGVGDEGGEDAAMGTGFRRPDGDRGVRGYLYINLRVPTLGGACPAAA